MRNIAFNLVDNSLLEGDSVKNNLAAIVGGAKARDQAGGAGGRAGGARGGEASGDAKLLGVDVSDRTSII